MRIEIGIQAGQTTDASSATMSGSQQHVIRDVEVQSFKISEKPLKTAIETSFGKKPNDAYLRSPDKYNLYKTYGWQEVQTVLVPTSVEVLDSKSVPVIVAQQIFKNDSSVKTVINVGISQSVPNTSSSKWSKSDMVEFLEPIAYEIGLVGGGIYLSYHQLFGEDGIVSTPTQIGSPIYFISLDPKKAVESVLTANRSVMRVKVVYKAYLTGDTATNYNPAYEEHHFWALDIGDVMTKGGISNEQTFTEILEIDFYASANIELRDPTTGEKLTGGFNLLGRPGVVSKEVPALAV
jgi:hypothetical protein